MGRVVGLVRKCYRAHHLSVEGTAGTATSAILNAEWGDLRRLAGRLYLSESLVAREKRRTIMAPWPSECSQISTVHRVPVADVAES